MEKSAAGSVRKRSRLRAHDTTIDLNHEDVFELPASCFASETPTSSVPEIIDLASEDQHEQPEQLPGVVDNDNGFTIFELFKADDLPPPSKIPSLDSASLPCPLCFGNMFKAPKVLSTKCGHLFCQECITSSLQRKSVCPMCRKKVTKSQVHVVYLNTS